MPEAAYIVCENLVKIYQLASLEVFALQGLDLAIMPGEMLGVVGPSGSGKSSLLNVIGGLERPTAGRVWVGGQDLFKLRSTDLDRYRRERVGFVWQQGARNLIPYLTALENVILPMRLAGQPRGRARQRAASLLNTVGLGDRLGYQLVQLSGGEQQRVAIAIAMANQPDLLLADEPTGEVDTASARVIYELFRQVNRQDGITTIIVSHDPGISQYVDRVVSVRDGKLASETVRLGEGEHTGHTELVILDSAGRLQIPKDYLNRFNIQRRVTLEEREDGILIRPAAHNGSESLVFQNGEAELTEADDLIHTSIFFKAARWLSQLRKRPQ